jgi:hypothetical protein
MDNIISINVKNSPYKKMNGLLKSHKIDSKNIALKLKNDYSKFTILSRWQNYLPDSHKVSKILLLKKNKLFLFVGYSNDDKEIIYNPDFSKLILENAVLLSNNQSEVTVTEEKKSKRKYIKRNKPTRLDILLEKISRSGINSLLDEEKNELDSLSKE